MGANILSFCDFEEQDYKLIAIHTVLQDYKLAYWLNSSLCFKLDRIVPDLDYVIKKEQVCFSAFKYHDAKDLIDWFLIRNKVKITEQVNSLGLFYTEGSFTSSYVYLQPEIKEADFLLKIQGDFLDLKMKNLLRNINKIKGVMTAYSVDTDKLNHKEYLIF